MRIRIAHPQDAGPIQQLLFETWLETYPNAELGITKEGIAREFAPKLSSEQILRRERNIYHSPSGHLLVAVHLNSIIGVMRGSPGELCELRMAYVHPLHQHRGAGTALWQELHARIGPTQPWEVWAATYNQQAIRFYEKLGFVKTGDTTGFRRASVDGIDIPQLRLVRPAT